MNESLDAEQIRVQLAAEISRLIRDQKLSAAAVGERLGLAESDVARLSNAEPNEFSIDRLVDVLNELGQRVEVTVSHHAQHSLLEKIAEIRVSVPPEEWDKLPRDLAANHDHYLYGTPKRD